MTVVSVFSKPEPAPEGYEALCDHYERVLKTIADADPLSARGLLQELAKEALEKGEGMRGLFHSSPFSPGDGWISGSPQGIAWSDVRMPSRCATAERLGSPGCGDRSCHICYPENIV